MQPTGVLQLRAVWPCAGPCGSLALALALQEGSGGGEVMVTRTYELYNRERRARKVAQGYAGVVQYLARCRIKVVPYYLTIREVGGLTRHYYVRVCRSPVSGLREIETRSASRLDIREVLGRDRETGTDASAHALHPKGTSSTRLESGASVMGCGA